MRIEVYHIKPGADGKVPFYGMMDGVWPEESAEESDQGGSAA